MNDRDLRARPLLEGRQQPMTSVLGQTSVVPKQREVPAAMDQLGMAITEIEQLTRELYDSLVPHVVPPMEDARGETPREGARTQLPDILYSRVAQIRMCSERLSYIVRELQL